MCISYKYALSFTTAILADIIYNVIRPLLLSAVSTPTSEFNVSIDAALVDVTNALNGYSVNLTITLSDYFKAVSRVYFDQAINSFTIGGQSVSLDLNDDQTDCGVQAVFNHVYTNADAAAELVELFQNISTAISIINKVCNYILGIVDALYYQKLMAVLLECFRQIKIIA